MQRAVAIIPARYNSFRFTGKPLALLNKKPIIQHVYENVRHARLIDKVLVATDDERIYGTVRDFGGTAVMTSVEHASGTDRIAEAARDIECDIVVNIQGDEPFIHPDMVDDVVDILIRDDRALVGTLAKRMTDIDDILSPDVVKVVMDNEGFALYFSRAPIPYIRDEWKLFGKGSDRSDETAEGIFEIRTSVPLPIRTHFFKHIGIYGYRRKTLLAFTSMDRSMLEKTEKLEQLRVLACGLRIKVRETEHDTLGIDTVDDLRKGEQWLNTYS
jgi:3-deoxy-manno-octulosonate cytidylyltransferase (CMP-KDO synthetase)